MEPGAPRKAFLEFFSHCRTLHSAFWTKENKWTTLAFRLRQFKHRPILKTAKGHAEGDLAWVSGRRKYFHFSSYFNWAVAFGFFSSFSFFVNDFFFLLKNPTQWQVKKKTEKEIMFEINVITHEKGTCEMCLGRQPFPCWIGLASLGRILRQSLGRTNRTWRNKDSFQSPLGLCLIWGSFP